MLRSRLPLEKDYRLWLPRSFFNRLRPLLPLNRFTGSGSLYIFFDRAERNDFWSRLLLFIFLFFFPPFLVGKSKGEKNNQSRGQKPCLSARSIFLPVRLPQKRPSYRLWLPNTGFNFFKYVWMCISCRDHVKIMLDFCLETALWVQFHR